MHLFLIENSNKSPQRLPRILPLTPSALGLLSTFLTIPALSESEMKENCVPKVSMFPSRSTWHCLALRFIRTLPYVVVHNEVPDAEANDYSQRWQCVMSCARVDLQLTKSPRRPFPPPRCQLEWTSSSSPIQW